MRILHTSDWHLGRTFHRAGMLDAQAAFSDHLVDVVRAEKVDVVLVAGDVYDRALPGVDVVSLLDDTLARLSGTGTHVVMSSGNHDSARRLGFASRLLSAARVHVRTEVGSCADPVVLEDRHGPVALYPLPYLEPGLVAAGLGTGRSHAAVLGSVMDAVRDDLAGRPAGTRSVVGAHAFVVGGTASDSERDISVGGVPSVPAETFRDVDYVALGHLHGRQRLREAVRYSGSPLPYSFSEVGQVKGSWLVELGGSGLTRVDAVEAPVPRPLAVLSGELEPLLSDPGLARHEGSWCQVTLTDAARPVDAMARVRVRFPHALELRFAPAGRPAAAGRYAERIKGLDDLAVCRGFLDHVRGRPADDAEAALFESALEHTRRGDPEETGVRRR
ncbi:MAG: repair protein SbcD/Mre11 [Actinomycetota bacterium]|nr:repair protein SbcD/Mre11 [Actinomycetota bacterium]